MKITQQRLHELLAYDAASGAFTWRAARKGRGCNQVKAGGPAGYRTVKGYITIKVDGCTYKAHRLAWLYMTGEWPSELIDHIDGVKDNNRFANLRPATLSENAQNTLKPSRNNKAGLLGVSWDKKQEKWAATIYIDGKNKRLGRFRDPHEAHAAYLNAKAVHHSAPVLAVCA
jgi:hypothetical protein